ncbi:phosphotransferase family protein [Caenimonas sp. SL110]|uniref:phosphotransferase family protein n=1 Tax=Caenimonas sp. SL110 TaxID=1450524 RepID=UPI00069CE2DF|nr:phosphotransferase family protein [Caenimonas sp. SL110]
MTEIASPSPRALDLAPECLGPRLEAFLQGHWKAPVRLSNWKRFPAGFSWVTLGCSAAVQQAGAQRTVELILRIGDPKGLLAPYQARPEFMVLQALQAVPGLPVPVVHAYSDDASIIGAPFLITGRVQGDTPMPWKGDAQGRRASDNEALSQDFTDAMAALHRVDWRGTPLGQLWAAARPDTVARDQLRHWARHAGMLDAATTAVPPQMHYAMRWLDREAPVADQVTIVHGDFRVGNFLQQDGRITAILDWELVHAGDPLEDIAWAGLRVFAAGTPRIGGLIERETFNRRYAEMAGVRLRPDVIHYYEVLGLFKSASMLMGATQRVACGSARDVRMASMGFQLASTLLEMNRLITQAPR